MGTGGSDAVSGREFNAVSRLAAIVESSGDAILSKTLEGVITSWNAGAAHMYGYAPDEMVGHNISELIPPDRAGELEAILDRLRRGEQVEHFETKRRRKDGSLIDVSVCISPVRDSSGAVVEASTVARDVTDRNRIDAERLELVRKLHQSERLDTLGRLAAGIAHDFNNLLSAIMNYAGFVADGTAGLPEVRHDAEQIQAAARRAAELTRQLLIFARQEETQPEMLDLSAIITGLRDLVCTSIGAGIELRVAPAADLGTVMADRGQMERVVLNLAVNARDAMPKGGTLTIATGVTELGGEYARLYPGARPGRYAELTVSDTGTGIPADVAARMFEPFYTTKRAGEGTGLGLSTVYGIVTRAGGTIGVDSAEGAGTTFRVYLPCTGAPGAPAPAAPQHAAPGSGRQGGTILIVDDEPAMLEVASRILRKDGYATLEAGTCEEALALASSADFQLLLTDSVMPGMSGPTLAEHIAGLRPGLPVLHMSGNSAGVLSQDRIRDGELAFVQKPFNAHDLLEKVSAALDT
jgi:two-component system, cell cycle sensor histidine kinase and response regulator CckA